jgi:hypothetical protein
MEGIFSQLFTKLSVNTIGRSDNIDDLLLSNIGWENDALTIKFGNTKSDIEGETTSEVKRLYANPFMPNICVVLALAIYTWCKYRRPQDIHLFDGGDQNKRYYKELLRAVEEIPHHIDIGCKRCDVGTHSNRKFAESTSASRIDGPSRTQVCLRAGQSVGRTQDCYIFAEEDGDSLVGRTVAQLKFDADQFDVLPAHFSSAALIELDTYGWHNIIEWYSSLPESFRRAIPYLFASLVYHHHNGDLSRVISTDHPLYSARIFRDRELIDSLRDKIILTHSYCTDTHMSAQGVPGFIIISREVRQLRSHYEQTCMQNERQYADLSAQIDQHARVLPDKIAEVLLEKVQVNGAQPVTLDAIRSLISQVLSSDGGPLADICRSMQSIDARLNTLRSGRDLASVDNEPATANTNFQSLHSWPGVDDRFHRVPPGFKWPTGKNTRIMWDYWFFGDANSHIGPFKNIESRYDLQGKACKTRKSRTKGVIDKLVDLAKEAGKVRNQSEVTLGTSAAVFDFAYSSLMLLLYPDEPDLRTGDLICDVIYERMRMKKLIGKTTETSA